MNKTKTKITEDQFVKILYAWLSDFVTKEKIGEIVNEIDFEIKVEEDFDKLSAEFFSLYMWLIVYTCKGKIHDEGKRNRCLDSFHHFIYDKHMQEKESDFNTWLKSIGMKYIEYDNAIKTEHPSTPLWVLATLINKNLFGEIREDFFLQTRIVNHIGLFIENLGKTIKQYEIIESNT